MKPDDPLNADPPGQVRIDWLRLANQFGGLHDAADGDARRLRVLLDRRRRWWSRDRNRTQDAYERIWAYANAAHDRWRRPIVFLKHQDLLGNSLGGHQLAGLKLTRNKLDDLGCLRWGRRGCGWKRRRGQQQTPQLSCG